MVRVILKYGLFAAIVGMFGILSFLFIGGRLENPPVPQLQQIPSSPPISVDGNQIVITRLLTEVNAKVASVDNFVCEDVSIKLWEKNLRFKLTGKLYCQKPRNFRFLISSNLAQELDLGSNFQVFWFWSRRNKTPGLFYAAHEDYYQTRLKTPFNPNWLRDSIGFSEIKTVKWVKETDTDWIFINPEANTSGQQLLSVVFVEKSTYYIRSNVLTNLNGQVLASSEIQERQNGLPYKILYSWYEEGNRFMLIEMRGFRTNVTIDPSLWSMPNIQPKIDMATE